jgi:RAD51-like protein 2
MYEKVRVVVLDSVAFHFRRGFDDMALRSRLLTGMAQELLAMAKNHRLAVCATTSFGCALGRG